MEPLRVSAGSRSLIAAGTVAGVLLLALLSVFLDAPGRRDDTSDLNVFPEPGDAILVAEEQPEGGSMPDMTPSASAVRQTVVTAREDRGDGQILLVSLHPWLAESPPRWTARHADGTSRSAVGWRLDGLTAGRWTLAPEDAGWLFTTPVVEVRSGERAVVWTIVPVEGRLSVRNQEGAPVAGASVLWVPATPDGCELGINPHRVLGETNENGIWRGVFDDHILGRLYVLRTGFVPQERIHDWALDRECSVVLERARSDRHALVLVEDARSSQPVTGVELRFLDKRVLAISDGMGNLEVPSEALDAGALELAGSGYGVVSTSGAELAATTRLWPLAPCRFVSTDGGDFELHVLEVTWPAEAGTLLPARFAPESSEGGVLKTALPAGLNVRVLAFRRDGHDAAETTVRILEDATFQLAFATEDVLQLETLDELGNPLNRARGRIVYDSRTGESPVRWVTSGGDGRLEVPAPGRVMSVRIEAPGHATVHLVRSRDLEAISGGHLRVYLSRAVDLQVRAVDAAGAGIPGIVLRLSRREWIDPTLVTDFVDDSPTGHAAWRSRKTAHVQTTDQEGGAHFSLVPGQYKIRATLPWIRNPGVGLYAATGNLVVSNNESENRVVELRVPRPTWVAIEAWDEVTRHLVSAFDVEAVGGASKKLRRKSSQGWWEGWVADDIHRIVVRAKGYRPFEIATEMGVPGRVRCGLIPADVVLLRVEADRPLPERFSLGYRVLEDMVDDELGWRIGERIACSGVVEISGHLGFLALPFNEECAVELLEVRLDGRTWSPEPTRVRWAPRREAEISVRLVSSGESGEDVDH